ncbi:MAG: indolepyruvate oxidoreductase subunit B [Rhodospirillaceae bacterium]|nr:indolepyruvate oxidoreductase subunit B [Rhodospirillaceae bacterium]
MTDAQARPVTLLVAALGGEGGGVLTDWVVAAAHAAGYPVQATSIPGVAQRTGATTYYMEIWPEPTSALNGKRPVFALAPAQGEVDIVAATELLEAGRCIMNGYVTPDRTHLIASTHRTYTTLEKMAPGDGRLDADGLRKAAEALAKKSMLADLGEVASESGAFINAVVLGAIAATGLLPMGKDALEEAIRATGKAVNGNLKGFQAGLDAGKQTAEADAPGILEDLDAIVAEARERLADFQDAAYADQYEARLAPFRDGEPAVAVAVARNLAQRMAYGDIIRVAQTKIRKRPQAAADGGVVHVTQYFRPGLAEICDILPPALAKRWLARAEHDEWFASKQWAMELRTTTIWGFARLSFLAKLKPLRRRTYRYGVEQNAIDAWLDDVRRAAVLDAELGVEAAEMSRLIKGYGKTHARGTRNFKRVRESTLLPALDNGSDTQNAVRESRKAVDAARSDMRADIADA